MSAGHLPPQRDFAPDLQQGHRVRSAESTKRANAAVEAVDWDRQIKRLRKILNKHSKDEG